MANVYKVSYKLWLLNSYTVYSINMQPLSSVIGSLPAINLSPFRLGVYRLICSTKNHEEVLSACSLSVRILCVCNSRYHECGHCIVKSRLLLEFFAKYVPLIMFLMAIILLDINLASGQMNTFSSLKGCNIWTSTLVDKFPYQMLPNHL